MIFQHSIHIFGDFNGKAERANRVNIAFTTHDYVYKWYNKQCYYREFLLKHLFGLYKAKDNNYLPVNYIS